MSKRALLLASILSAAASLLHAQAMTEFGAAAGRGAAAAGGVGKSIVDVFGKVNQSVSAAGKVDEALKPAPPPAAAAASIAATSVPAATPKTEPVLPPDLKELVVGL